MTGRGDYTVESLSLTEPAHRTAWNRLSQGCGIDGDFLAACERAHMPEFWLGAIGVFREGHLVAGVPLYSYRFPTRLLMRGRARTLVEWISRWAPNLTDRPMIAAGSPYAEELPLTIAAELAPAERREVLRLLIARYLEIARERRAKYLHIQDVSQADSEAYGDIFRDFGFFRTPALPLAFLHVAHGNADEYVQSLRRGVRRNIRRSEGIELVIRDDVGGMEHELWRLRQNIAERAAVKFADYDHLHERFFDELLAFKKTNHKFFTYYYEGRLIGFVYILIEKNRMIAKEGGAEFPIARDKCLYFFRYVSMVDFAIRHNIKWIQVGLNTYPTKVSLGCRLVARSSYSRAWLPVPEAIGNALFPRLSVSKINREIEEMDEADVFFVPGTGPAPVERTFDLAMVNGDLAAAAGAIRPR